jgi:hypothetical protein
MNLSPSLPVHCRGSLLPVSELVSHPAELPPASERVTLRAQALLRNGWREPVIVSRQTGRTVIGEDLVEAARVLGLPSVPVEKQDFADEADEAFFAGLDARAPQLIRG